MAKHTSAKALAETPHEPEATTIAVNDAIRDRAQSVTNDGTIDPQWRMVIHYALELDDPWLPELVRRAEAREDVVTTFESLRKFEGQQDCMTEEKIRTLAEIICRGGNECVAALLVLMGTLENSACPNLLANRAKHFAFVRCSELNLYGVVDTQIAVVENELLTGNELTG